MNKNVLRPRLLSVVHLSLHGDFDAVKVNKHRGRKSSDRDKH